MGQQLKQRLVGAVTIVSLLIIFLPIIFDGSGYKHQQLLHMNLDTPAQPHLIIEQELNKLPELGNQSIKHIYEEINLNASLGKKRVKQQSANQSSSTGQWKIQVGVFAQETNAKAYVATLMEKKYPARYGKAKTRNGMHFVVDVVSSDEKEIRTFVPRLKKDMGLDKLVVERQ